MISPQGDYLGEIGDVFRPCAIHVAADGTMLVAELGADMAGRRACRFRPA